MLKEFDIDGMSCLHCVAAVEEKLNKLDILSMEVVIGKVIVKYDPEITDDVQIINAIEEAGYKVIKKIEI